LGIQLRRWLPVAGRLGLAAIFLYAGYAKLREPWLQFAISIDSFKAVPESWLEPMARLLPWCEVALGIALLSGILARWFSLIATLMLGLFFSVGVRAFAKGLTVDCGCFGPPSRPLTEPERLAELRWAILRDLALLALAAQILAQRRQ